MPDSPGGPTGGAGPSNSGNNKESSIPEIFESAGKEPLWYREPLNYRNIPKIPGQTVPLDRDSDSSDSEAAPLHYARQVKGVRQCKRRESWLVATERSVLDSRRPESGYEQLPLQGHYTRG